MRSHLVLAIAASLALSSAGLRAAVPTPPVLEANADDTMAVPVWNSSSGKLEAVLWIDTSTLGAGSKATRALGTRWTSVLGQHSASVSAQVEPQLGLLCGNASGALDRLGEDCLVTQFGRPAPAPTSQLIGEASTRIGRSEWTGFGSMQRSSTDALLPGTTLSIQMPELLPLAATPGIGVEQNDLGVAGELRVGQQGWVRVGGSVARARLVPAGGILPGSVAPSWNSRTLSLGGGIGAIGGEVVGRVVRVPGESERFGTLGLGVTWRTPWAGRLTVGAQNVISAGENPVTPRAAGKDRDEGRVPYVRYQQDL